MPGLAAGLVRLGAGTCSMPNKINQQVAFQWYVQLPAVVHMCYARARCTTVHTWLVRLDIDVLLAFMKIKCVKTRRMSLFKEAPCH